MLKITIVLVVYSSFLSHGYAHLIFSTATSTPLLKDLYEYITPQYATDWKVIGTLLGLPMEEQKITERDYNKVVSCCNAMLEKWLEVDPSASWNKLLNVIQSPAVSNNQVVEKGNPCNYINILQVVTSSFCLSCRS